MNEVKIRVTAEDKTKGVFNGVKAGMKAVVTGALVLGTGLVVAMGKASEAARESAKITAQTAAVIKSTGGAANISAKGVDDLANALSKKTGIDDEVIKSGENMLLTFTNVRNEAGKGNKIFTEATKVITDMSVALGQDTKTSAMQLGKALNDPIKGITALKRVGVTFNDEQVKTITHLTKTGKVAEAQKVILAELRKEFGGSAEAQATWADKAKVAVGNIEEAFGDLVNKTFAPIGKWFVEVGAPAIEDFFKKLQKNKDLKASLKALGDAVKGITGKDFAGTLNDVAKALPGIVDGMADAAHAVGEFYRAIVAVNDIIGKQARGGMFDEKGPLGFITTWVKKTWREAVGTLKQRLGEAIAGIKNFVGRVGDWFSKLPGRVTGAIRGLGSKIGEVFTGAYNAAVSKVKALVSRVVDWFKSLPGKAKSAVSSLAAKIGSEVEQAKNLALRKVKDLANRFVDWVRGIPGKSKSALSSLAAKIGSEVEQAKDNVLRKARDMVNRFIDRMQDMVRQARSQAGRVKGAILDQFSGAGSWLVAKGRAVINGLLGGMKAAFAPVKRWVSGIASWIKAHKGPVSLDRQLLHPAGKALMEGLLGGLKFGFKGVGDFVYKVGGTISDIIGKIKSTLFGGFGSLNLGKLASGGYRVLGRAMAAAYGWTGAQWNALNALWTRESGWNPRARNPSSGAAGIPQDITGNFHGGAAGQIAWGLRYIKGRYGSPLAAWAHSQRTGWYDQGGMLPSGGVAMNASGRPERILSPVQTRSFDRMVRAMERGGGGVSTTIIINAPNYVGSHEDLKRALVDLNRRGQLEVIKR